jgi:hypothetical protein
MVLALPRHNFLVAPRTAASSLPIASYGNGAGAMPNTKFIRKTALLAVG